MKLMPESLKVPKDAFERVMKALLNTPPMPASEIGGKKKTKRAAKKRG
jgi:hypothetical protein